MASSFIPLETLRRKFYQKEHGSNKLMNVTDEKLSLLMDKVEHKQKMDSDNTGCCLSRFSKLERYLNSLRYLTNPFIHLELPSFDERVIFLMMMNDPELVTYREFLKTNLISMTEISKVEDIKERSQLIRLRDQTLAMYETRVRETIGFYDPKLLKYEEMFFKKFLSKKELVTEVEISNQDSFVEHAKTIESFDSISDVRYEKLVNIAQGCLALVPGKYDSRVATYNITVQRELLGLRSLEEQVALFILLVDSDLDMLRIYEEESMMPNVKRRIKEEFGYYNKDLLPIERKFHKRFCPEKELSIWTMTKKRLDCDVNPKW